MVQLLLPEVLREWQFDRTTVAASCYETAPCSNSLGQHSQATRNTEIKLWQCILLYVAQRKPRSGRAFRGNKLNIVAAV